MAATIFFLDGNSKAKVKMKCVVTKYSSTAILNIAKTLGSRLGFPAHFFPRICAWRVAWDFSV